MNEHKTLPTPQEAYNTLLEDVHNRIFFHKLASVGRTPRTTQEAEFMLQTAFKLRGAEKAAEETDSVYGRMYRQLSEVVDGPTAQQAAKQATTKLADDSMWEAAGEAMQLPAVYDAALALKAAEAADIENQLKARQTPVAA